MEEAVQTPPRPRRGHLSLVSTVLSEVANNTGLLRGAAYVRTGYADGSLFSDALCVLLAVAAAAAVGSAVAWLVLQLRARYLGGAGAERVGGYVKGGVLGRGGFGEVRRGHPLYGGEMIALKQPMYGTGKWSNEAAALKRLNAPSASGKPVVGFPALLFVEEEIIGMSLLGPSLEAVRRSLPAKRLSVKTALLLAGQALDRLYYMHNRRTLHRDIKPENLLLGRGDGRNTLHLVDFGLSERFYDPTKRSHKPYREGCTVYGTPYFSSVTADMGMEQSRRDDIEGLGYCLVYLVKGNLPWVGLKSLGALNTWHRRVVEMKRTMPVAELCEGLPAEFATLINHARSLKYTDTPDYSFLQGIIARRYAKLGFPMDDVYDWTEVGKDWPCWSDGGTPLEGQIDQGIGMQEGQEGVDGQTTRRGTA